MYKIFTLVAAIAVMPLSQNLIPSTTVDKSITSTPVFSFHCNNNNKSSFFEPEKKVIEPWSQDWMATAQENIRKSEYNFTWEEKYQAYCTPNRKNNLRFFYDDNGFSAEPRSTKIPIGKATPLAGPDEIKYKYLPGWKVRFSLDKKQFGHGNWEVANNKASCVTEKVTVEYINNDEGMRQNFIVRQPLSKSKKLKINFSVKTKLKAKLTGNSLQFFYKKINVLNYRDLKVWDANNKLLAASLHKKSKGRFYIQVDAKDAVYPITIDPISTGTAGIPDWQGDDANQAGAIFGSCVASAGDVNGDG
ncbi:MAG: hypothetical protein ACKOU7_01980, partial [Ferruginibacter sp.]